MRKLLAALLLLVSLPSWGVINGTAVQSARDSTGSATETIDAVDGWSAPASGNLLISILTVDNANQNASGDLSCPSGFTEIFEYETSSGFRTNWSVCFKEADGTETSIVASTNGQDLGDMALVVVELSGTDLDLSVVEAQNQNTGNTTTQSQTTNAASNTTADALAIYVFGLDTDNLWTGATIDNGTLQESLGTDSQAGSWLATEVLSAAGSQSATLTTTDTGSPALGGVIIFGGSASAPTLGLDDTSPEAGSTVRLTAGSAPGGTLTTATLVIDGETETRSCEAGATTLICDIYLDFAGFAPAGNFEGLKWNIAGTIKVEDGSANETQTTAITIDIPAAGALVNLTCTAGTDCDVGSAAITPMIANDDCAVVVTAGASLNTLDTDCVPHFNGSATNYTAFRYDESANAWLVQEEYDVASGCTYGMYQDPYTSPYENPYYTPTCN